MLGFAAPADLKIEVISTTSVKVTAIPPKNSTAEFFEVAIEEPWMGYFDKIIMTRLRLRKYTLILHLARRTASLTAWA